MIEKITRTEEEWKRILTPKQFEIMRGQGTERAFSGPYWDTKDPGTYLCAACSLPLFSSETKYDSGSGWPSFYEPVSPDTVMERIDDGLAMRRTEILCARCESHLGHVFPDGPPPTGLRYCINGHTLQLVPPGAREIGG